ncbi:hypothetical protein BUE65_22000, partial [Klebsiella variicola]
EALPRDGLAWPEVVGGFRSAALGDMRIAPGHDVQALPVPAQSYGADAFQALADSAREADKTQLARIEK